MGKGRSEKSSFKQYRDQIEWENQRRSSPKGYLGKWFNPDVWKVTHSPQEIFFTWTVIIGSTLFFMYMLVSNYDYTVLPFIILPAIAGVIIFFAIQDGIKRK